MRQLSRLFLRLLHLHFHYNLTPTPVVHPDIDAVDLVEGHLGRILPAADLVQDTPHDRVDRGEQPYTDPVGVFLAQQAPVPPEDDPLTHLLPSPTVKTAHRGDTA